MRTALRRLRRWVGVTRFRLRYRRFLLPRTLAAFADAYPEAHFAQVGANDGDHHDHLRPYVLGRGWRGVLVEPVPYLFERLTANYGALDRLTLVNVAVGPADGRMPFFHLRDASEEERRTLPDWYDGVGSFNRDALLAHAAQIPDFAERIVEREVETLRFETLWRRHGLGRLDLLLIDTEGYDWEIIRSVDLAGLAPRLVIYEHFHLSPEDRAACREHLRTAGYLVKEEGLDTLALREEDDRLTARFRRWRPGVGGVSKADEPGG